MSLVKFPKRNNSQSYEIEGTDSILEFLEQEYTLKVRKEGDKYCLDFDIATNIFDQEDMQQLVAELADVAGLGWQPIESAPKDGTDVLLSSNGFIEVGHYSSGEWQNVDSNVQLYPDFWRPLPQAPKVVP